MCAAKQFAVNQQQQFDLNQCAIKQYVYQYKEWQCVWNQHVAQQDPAELDQYFAQQYSQSQHAAGKYPDAMERYTRNHEATQQHYDEIQLSHSAVEPFLAEQWAEDFHPYTSRQDYEFNQYAAQPYLVEQFPRNCYQVDECVEEDAVNPFTTEQYALNSYFVDECHGKDYELNQLDVDNSAPEQYEVEPGQFGEHWPAYDPLADEQYGTDQYPNHWYSFNHCAEAQNFMYNYAVNQCMIEEQYQKAPHQFVPGHYTPEQYVLDQSEPTQAANPTAFPPQPPQFVAVRYGPCQYFADLQTFAVAAQYLPHQYPENVFGHCVVRQHAAPPFKGNVCPLAQWPPGGVAFSQHETHGSALQAAAQYQAQQNAAKHYALDQRALEQYALSKFEAEQRGRNQYGSEQNAEQHEPNQYLAAQNARNHQQQGSNPNAAEQFKVGRNALGQFKTKRGVTSNSWAKDTRVEERPGATEQDTNPGSAELSAAKLDCKETADLHAAQQEATQCDSAKPRVAEQDLDVEKNQGPGPDGPVVVGTSCPTQRSDSKESDFIEHNAATVQYEVEQNVTERKAPNWSKNDFCPSHDVRNRPQPNTSNHHSAAAQLTTNDMATPCDSNKKCGAAVQDTPVDSAEEESVKVGECSVSGQSTDIAEWGDCCTDSAEVLAVEFDSPEQKHNDTKSAEWDKAVRDTPVQDGTKLNTTELQSTGQEVLHQTARRLNILEWDVARHASSDLVEPESTKQDRAEQHVLKNCPEPSGVLQETFTPICVERDQTEQHLTGSYAQERPMTHEEHDDPGRDSAVQISTETVQAKQRVTEQRGANLTGAAEQGSAVEEQTAANDKDLDTVGQTAPERCGATTPVTAEQEPPENSSSAAEQGASENLRDMNPPAGRYRTRGGRSCRTGCSRALFNKGQSSKARYYSRSDYSTRYCND